MGLGVNQRAFAPLGVSAPALVDIFGGGEEVVCVAKSSDFLKLIIFSKCKIVTFFILMSTHWLAGLGSKWWPSALGFIVLIYKLVLVSPLIGLLRDQVRRQTA